MLHANSWTLVTWMHEECRYISALRGDTCLPKAVKAEKVVVTDKEGKRAGDTRNLGTVPFPRVGNGEGPHCGEKTNPQ